MHVLDTYVGNQDESFDDRLDDAETVVVDEDERRRSRFRTTTESGTEVGVVVGRELRTGDVIAGGGLTVVVELDDVAALEIDLSDASGSLAAAVELGHAVGNRHWDLAVEGDVVRFPLTESEERMRGEVEPYLPDGATVSTARVPPTTFDGDYGHGHAGGGHDHDHDHAHVPPHEHGTSDEDGGES